MQAILFMSAQHTHTHAILLKWIPYILLHICHLKGYEQFTTFIHTFVQTPTQYIYAYILLLFLLLT